MRYSRSVEDQTSHVQHLGYVRITFKSNVYCEEMYLCKEMIGIKTYFTGKNPRFISH
jgi:hypothetical protein